MAFLKIVAVALLASISVAHSSLVAHPAVRYTQVAPPSVLPFSAQVSTFTRNLHVFDAPYAAGVIPGPPAIVQRAIVPAPVAPFAPTPFVPAPVAPFAPAPFVPAPVTPFAPASLVPAAPVAPAPFLPRGAPFLPAYAPGFRSLHAVAPAYAPLLG